MLNSITDICPEWLRPMTLKASSSTTGYGRGNGAPYAGVVCGWCLAKRVRRLRWGEVRCRM